MRQNRIETTMTRALSPAFIDVVNESYQHNVPENSETHFKITIVSSEFESQTLIMRHRTINELLKKEFSTGLHALSIHAYTPERWKTINQQSPKSPACLDGFKNK